MGVIPALGIFSSREAREGPNVSTETSQSGIGLQDFLNGEGGIRTHGAREDTLVFKTRAINHSTTSPGGSIPWIDLISLPNRQRGLKLVLTMGLLD